MRDAEYNLGALEPRRLLATILGGVVIDQNGDARINPSEPGAAGVQVYLDANANDLLDAGETSTRTDADGGYVFTVPAGTYRVAQEQSPDGLRTYPGTGRMLLAGASSISNTNFTSLHEIDPVSGVLLNDLTTPAVGTSSAFSGNYVYTFNPSINGSLASVSVVQIGTNARANGLITPATATTEGTVLSTTILDNELYVRRATSAVLTVIDLTTGIVRRTIPLPTGPTVPAVTAMPDRHLLLGVTDTKVMWIDPQTGNVTKTASLPPLSTAAAPHLAYLNGTAFAQWGTSSYYRLDPATGELSPAIKLSTDGLLVSSESPSHLVTVGANDVAVASFARATYSPTAQAPVVLSQSGSGLAMKTRLSIRGTVAGATLSIFNPSLTTRDRKTLEMPAQDGTTIVEFTYDQIFRGTSFTGITTNQFAVYQTLPNKMPQLNPSMTMLGNGPSWSPEPPPYALPGNLQSDRPTIHVTTQAASRYAAVELYVDDLLVATKPVTSDDTLIQPDQPLAEGIHRLVVLAQTLPLRPGPAVAVQRSSPIPVSLTIDHTPPIASVRYAYDDAVPAVQVTFDGPIANPSGFTSRVSLEQLDAAGNVIATISGSQLAATVSADVRVVSLKRADGLSLVDGRYRLRFSDANPVRDLAGNALPTGVSPVMNVLAGDANHDGTVNFSDLVILAQNYNTTGKTFSQGNFDYSADGAVNFADLILLAQRYGTSLAPIAVPAARLATPSTKRTAAKSAASDVLR